MDLQLYLDASEPASCRPRQPALSSSVGFFQQSLTPSTAISGNWCLTRLLLHIIYLFPPFLPPGPFCQESCSLGRRQAGEDGGEDPSEPLPCSSSSSNPAGAMSTRQEARSEGGDSKKGGQEAELRDRAHLSQRRRLKQATQFLHKDSADLLPLDSLKRLGTSKDLQPHSVLQRRLVEGNQSRLQGESPLVQALVHGQENRKKTSETEIPALLVNCKCRDQVLRVAVDTGTHHNQISAGCLSRLGLGKRVLKAPGGDLAPGPPTQVEQLELQLGQETVACSAQVVDVESPEFCLGLQTLLSLKCCIDLEHGVLRLKAPFPELPFLPLHQEPGQ
ncbi:LOW QUALITY PROTEIN: nuclear receptor-interacting protein 2 [Pteropus vampyrus]|uniref:LOW QUALITY PROTEIN: nuclear receptor-interacting protein 2 n=1 Tax=Pteropus vampyrus TaxID=132908 RepID=A0A6P3QLA1_PTEVA|nr:LOW QUALITY PROTEIN: nuclear receptor-interacting protein 2 [Pteropus vampyrus]